MSASSIFFYVLSAAILGSALLAVTTGKIFRSAIWLLFSLVGVAALYFWMQAEFIAAVQIVVYVGGIVVLIIFSIFLTQRSGKKMPAPPFSRIVLALAAAAFGAGFTGALLFNYGFPDRPSAPMDLSVAEIGTQLLSTSSYGYILPFEAVSMLLFAAMVGCIVIAMKEKNVPENISPANTNV